MASYLVSTPGNPSFSGKVYGIPFTNGRAFVSEQTIDRRLGWTPDQIAFSMKNDFGYDVLELAQPANQPVLPPEAYPNIPPGAVYEQATAGIPLLKEVPAAPPEPEPEPEPEGKPEQEPDAEDEPEPTSEADLMVTQAEAPEGVEYQHESVLVTGEIDLASNSAPADEPAPASTKKKRATRRKGAVEQTPEE